jgi:hypothetical protein
MCDVTDAGLSEAARALPFRQICLWHDLEPVVRNFDMWGRSRVDYVYCTDVLEHIPPTFTMLVVQRLLDVSRRGVFLSIALVHDQFGPWVGTPLHQTVQSFVAWRDQLSELGEMVECRDLLNTGIYFLRSR